MTSGHILWNCWWAGHGHGTPIPSWSCRSQSGSVTYGQGGQGMMPRREARGWVAFARCSGRSAHRSRTDVAHSLGSADTPRSSRLRFILLLGAAHYHSTGLREALADWADRESDARVQTVPLSLAKIDASSESGRSLPGGYRTPTSPPYHDGLSGLLFPACRASDVRELAEEGSAPEVPSVRHLHPQGRACGGAKHSCSHRSTFTSCRRIRVEQQLVPLSGSPSSDRLRDRVQPSESSTPPVIAEALAAHIVESAWANKPNPTRKPRLSAGTAGIPIST